MVVVAALLPATANFQGIRPAKADLLSVWGGHVTISRNNHMAKTSAEKERLAAALLEPGPETRPSKGICICSRLQKCSF
jgi:hypothetical protein